MPTFQQRIAVEMDDGKTWEVMADQRDIAKWEVSPLHGEGRMFTMVRHLAWTASVRAGRTELKWGGFDAACVEASDPEEPEELDPTRPDQSDAS